MPGIEIKRVKRRGVMCGQRLSLGIRIVRCKYVGVPRQAKCIIAICECLADRLVDRTRQEQVGRNIRKRLKDKPAISEFTVWYGKDRGTHCK